MKKLSCFGWVCLIVFTILVIILAYVVMFGVKPAHACGGYGERDGGCPPPPKTQTNTSQPTATYTQESTATVTMPPPITPVIDTPTPTLAKTDTPEPPPTLTLTVTLPPPVTPVIDTPTPTLAKTDTPTPTPTATATIYYQRMTPTATRIAIHDGRPPIYFPMIYSIYRSARAQNFLMRRR
jgi:hypothetical protein